MVEVLIALLMSLFGTLDTAHINEHELSDAMEDAGIETCVLDELNRPGIPGNGQDLLCAGADEGSNGEPGEGYRD